MEIQHIHKNKNKNNGIALQLYSFIKMNDI